MAVMLIGKNEGMNADTYDAIGKEMNFPNEIPDGLLSHVAGPVDGGFQIVDVWESLEKFEAFMESTLMPAMAKVGYEVPASPQPPEQIEVYDRWPS
jgi:hypothetical protein